MPAADPETLAEAAAAYRTVGQLTGSLARAIDGRAEADAREIAAKVEAARARHDARLLRGALAKVRADLAAGPSPADLARIRDNIDRALAAAEEAP